MDNKREVQEMKYNKNCDRVCADQARSQDLTRGGAGENIFGGVFSDFLNNVWFVFTVVYGCFYYIVNAHYKD